MSLSAAEVAAIAAHPEWLDEADQLALTKKSLIADSAHLRQHCGELVARSLKSRQLGVRRSANCQGTGSSLPKQRNRPRPLSSRWLVLVGLRISVSKQWPM